MKGDEEGNPISGQLQLLNLLSSSLSGTIPAGLHQLPQLDLLNLVEAAQLAKRKQEQREGPWLLLTFAYCIGGLGIGTFSHGEHEANPITLERPKSRFFDCLEQLVFFS